MGQDPNDRRPSEEKLETIPYKMENIEDKNQKQNKAYDVFKGQGIRIGWFEWLEFSKYNWSW